MIDSATARIGVLRVLRSSAMPDRAKIADRTGLPSAVLDPVLDALRAEQLVTMRERPREIWMLGAAGRAEYADWIGSAVDAAGVRDRIRAAYLDFLELNPRLIAVCGDWQVRAHGGERLPNDHTDTAYDAAVLARLDEIHARVGGVLDDLAGALGWFAGHRERLEAARRRLLDGDGRWLTALMLDSYHTIWFEIHEDLLACLGMTRAEESRQIEEREAAAAAPAAEPARYSGPYVFDLDEARGVGAADRRGLLGGKAESLVTMRDLDLPVPPAFTISTQACRYFLAHAELPPGLTDEVDKALKTLEAVARRGFGDPQRPLLLSVRSGAPVSMPGMMDTVLNVGVTSSTADALSRLHPDPDFAADVERRFLESFGTTVLGIPAGEFPAAGTPDGARGHRDVLREHAPDVDMDDVRHQLWASVRAVFSSWRSPRAVAYRALKGVPDDLGTGVTVQAMVFGNAGADSGTGVAFTRDPNTGRRGMYGDFLSRAQGEDVVSGRRTTVPLAELADLLPEVWRQLCDGADRLERHFRDMCDIEFTVEDGHLWFLQVRRGKRAAAAAVQIAVDLVDEGLATREQALRALSVEQVAALARPAIQAGAHNVLTTGLNASPGLATGRISLSADEVAAAEDATWILVRPETSPEDVHGMARAAGILTSRGGLVSHAAVVARELGVPAVVGARDLVIDEPAGRIRIGGHELAAGDILTLDGDTGRVIAGEVAVRAPEPPPALGTVLGWADEVAGATGGISSPAARLAAAQKILEGETQ